MNKHSLTYSVHFMPYGKENRSFSSQERQSCLGGEDQAYWVPHDVCYENESKEQQGSKHPDLFKAEPSLSLNYRARAILRSELLRWGLVPTFKRISKIRSYHPQCEQILISSYLIVPSDCNVGWLSGKRERILPSVK